ncbi:MAG: M43 family zinc metalloprotease [Phycisphaerales bacterium]
MTFFERISEAAANAAHHSGSSRASHGNRVSVRRTARRRTIGAASLIVGMVAAAGAATTFGVAAPTGPGTGPWQGDDGVIRQGEQIFASWSAYFLGPDGISRRTCGHMTRPGAVTAESALDSPADCTFTFTNPAADYDPSLGVFRVPVVVHVIRNSSGTQGNVPMSRVLSQIEILNEDFRALPGTPGAGGTDVGIEFFLATEDPSGNPTDGVTYSNNTQWYNDGGAYWNTLAWDTNRYLNIYTNTAGGDLGYVPDLPQGGIAGQNSDRVVVLWEAFGRNAPIGAPFNQGRTATHEVGHYFGLEHTFFNGCGSLAACNSTGDLICDTNRQSFPTTGCGGSSCGSLNPFDNFMDYSDDTCMERFTPEQARRMRCSLVHYRPQLSEIETECAADVDGSGAVDFGDIVSVLSAFGPCPGCTADVDASGSVDFTDLVTVLSAWGPC